MTKRLKILMSLHPGYGMGDAVQVSSILRHVAKYRPHWSVDFQAEEGRWCVGRGHCANVFLKGTEYPSSNYDADIQILLFDTWANWGDRPNTRVSSCLRDTFDLDWDEECGRYQIQVTAKVAAMVEKLIPPRMVAVHYQGDSSPERKNLTHEQAAAVCEEIRSLGRTPLLLDWRNKSPLNQHYLSIGCNPLARYGGDAEVNCAVISRCEAFVGIDSGPSKCASATDTPALVTWTGHHPAPFHDPAPNTTHNVPVDYHGLYPVCYDAGVIRWFEQHYRVRQYESDPVVGICTWLKETLK